MLEPKETFEISVVRFNWISDDNCSRYKLHRNSLACLRGPINTSYSIKWICSKEFKGQTRRIYQRIHLSAGTAGDSFSFQRGAPFSTKDQDNDPDKRHCARTFKGGWWYSLCRHANLNGLYQPGPHSSHADGINWYHWKGNYYSAKRSEMKIRPVNLWVFCYVRSCQLLMNKIQWIIFKLPSFLCMCNVKESCDERSLLEERTLRCYEWVKDLAFIATPFSSLVTSEDCE